MQYHHPTTTSNLPLVQSRCDISVVKCCTILLRHPRVSLDPKKKKKRFFFLVDKIHFLEKKTKSSIPYIVPYKMRMICGHRSPTKWTNVVPVIDVKFGRFSLFVNWCSVSCGPQNCVENKIKKWKLWLELL